MKNVSTLFLAFTLAVALSGCVTRGDSGRWTGAVVSRDGVHTPYSCDVELDVTHTDSVLVVHSIATSCPAYASKWRAGSYEVHGTSLWRDGRVVGWARSDGSVTLELDDYVTDERYPRAASRVVISWTKQGDSLEYSEESYFAGRTQRSSGWLQKKR